MQPARWQAYAPYAFLAAVVFAVYSNIYDNVLLFDDDLLIHLNTYLRSWSTFGKLLTASTTEGARIAGGFYRPVQNLLYFFIFQMGGENVLGYHLLNVALHIGNACLGYRLALRLGIDARAAILGMLLWVLHPLHTEAITYMSGTADPLFVFFCLCGLNLLFPELTLRKILNTVPLFVLALLSKETGVVFPALVCVCLFFVSPERLRLKTYLPTWPLWLIAGLFLAWRINDASFDGPTRYAELFHMPQYAPMRMYGEDPFLRFTTFLATLPAYVKLLFWPLDLHMERTFPMVDDLASPSVMGGLAMLVAAAMQIIWGRGQRGAALSWGLLWFGVAHAPNTGLLCAMNSLFLEHWMYLPTIGLMLGCAQTVTLWIDHLGKPALGYTVLSFVFAAIIALSARTYDQNEVWREPIVFYNNIFSHGAYSPRAHNNLAIAYADIRNYPKAIEEYRRAIREGDTYAETHYNLALSLLAVDNRGANVREAIEELERSLLIEPNFYRSHEALSKLYEQVGDRTKAAYHHQQMEMILGHGAN